MKVQRELLPDFYELCYGVKEQLGYNEKVDFYITGNSSVNAFSLAAEDGEKIGSGKTEVASAISGAIQRNYVPSMESLW